MNFTVTKLDTVEYNGISFDLFVDTAGRFSATLDGADIKATTLDDLKTRLRTLVKRAKKRLAIPATLLEKPWHSDKPTLSSVTITGKHAANERILYKNDATGHSDSAGTVDRGSNFLRRLTTDEIDELRSLHGAIGAAQKAYDACVDRFSINAYDAIRDARKVAGDVDPD